MLVWGLDRGFDITDEGAYLLAYRYPDAPITPLTSFDLIVGTLLGALNPGIVTYRTARLVVTLLSSYAFAWGLVKWLRAVHALPPESGMDFPFIFLFISLGNFLSYSFGPQSISYNSLSNAMILVVAGLMLALLSKEGGVSGRWKWVERACFVMGMLSGLLFFIKFPTSISLLGVSVLVLMIEFHALGARKWMAPLLFWGGGVCSGMVLFFVLFQDFSSWSSNFFTALTAFPEWSHNPASLMRQYASQLFDSGKAMLAHYWVVFAGVALLAGLTRNERLARWAPGRYGLPTAAVGVGLLFVYQSSRLYAASYIVIFSALIIIAILAAQVICLAVFAWRERERPIAAGTLHADDLSVYLLLGVLPIVGAIGTNNPLLMKTVDYITPWFALSLILMLRIFARVPSKLLLTVFVFSMALFAQSLTVYGYIYTPYRVPTNLILQTERVESPGSLQGIHLDPASKEFVEQLASLTSQRPTFQAGDTILALYDMPGLVYLLGGTSPGKAWYAGAPQEQRRNCAGLSATKHAELRKAILLIGREIHPEFLACMRRAGLSYPEGYELLGGLRSPYTKKRIEVWAPASERK
jgi:hypothetical protein